MNIMQRTIATLVASSGCAIAAAQTVEFRIVERTGQTAVISASDAELDMAVQARVIGGTGLNALGGFSFDIFIHDEHDTLGTLAKLRISAADGTYFTGPSVVNATVGAGGLAKTFTYLAGISAAFNGLINISSGTFTNQPGQQEIGLITASATGSALLGTPGLDPDGEGHPATWSGYGTGATPNSGSTASLDPAIAGPYFAAGQFIDVYRFRYTPTTLTTRTLQFDLRGAAAQTFTQFLYNNGSWGGQSTTVPAGNISVTPASIPIALADMGACCDIMGPCTISTGAACTGPFFLGTCTPDPCPPLGSCCPTSGACTTILQANCTGVWTAAGSCAPNPCPQPGACCALNEACTLRLQPNCTGVVWYAGTCSPSPCSTPGACCGATCQFVGPASCTSGSVWMPGTCSPSPCPPRIACCNTTTGACSLTTPTGDVVYTYSYTITAPGYFRNDDGGAVETITATYNANTKRLTFDTYLIRAISTNPTTGFWLVLSNGPNPKAHPGELAIFYFDATNIAAPLLTVYGYNGADAGTSWSDGNPALPGDQPGDLIKGLYESSYIHAILAEDVTVSGQPRRRLMFDIDASDIITHTPLYPATSPWYGGRFDSNLGLWLHPVTGFAATYEPNINANRGRLTSLAFIGEGWLDSSSSRPTTDTDPCPSGWVANVDGACSPTNLCPQRHACCSSGGICLLALPRDDCPSNYTPASPPSSTCSPNPCPTFALQPSGACCNTMTGICCVLPQGACDSPTHTCTWSAGASCPNGLCPPVTGACCNVVVSACIVCDQAACGPAAHDWFAGRSCTPDACAVPGICCDSAGACRRFTQARCTSGGGWAPTGTCTPNPCPLPGACCNIVVGSCQVTLQSDCAPAAHDWMPGLACSSMPCATPGICCDFTTGACRRLTRSRCLSGSVWSEQRICTPNPCSGAGACCDAATSVCRATYLAACDPATSDWTLAGSCLPHPCAQIGACCEPISGACSPLTQARCDIAKVWLDSTPCSPNPCFMPQGACCNVVAGTCTLRVQTECGAAANDWIASATCTPGACEAPAACCDTSAGTCCRLTPTRCAAIEGTWLDALTCIPNPCSSSFFAACPADFDRSGRVDLGDALAYIEAWFAHEPRADFNSGGLVDVADLFDFFSAWLAGCPNYQPTLPNPMHSDNDHGAEDLPASTPGSNRFGVGSTAPLAPSSPQR